MTLLHFLSHIIVVRSNITIIIRRSSLWDTSDPLTVTTPAPILCFLCTYTLLLLFPLKVPEAKKMYRTILEEYIVLPKIVYFRHLYSTGLQSLMGHTHARGG